MELSAAHSGNSSILSDIAFQQAAQESGDVEGLLLPEEFAELQTLKEQAAQGLLRGEARQHKFVQQESSSLPEKIPEQIRDLNRPSEYKILDPKNGKHDLSFKESTVREKEFKVLEPHKQNLEETPKEQIKTLVKAHEKGNEALQKGQAPKSALALKENAAVKQQQSQAKTLESRVRQELVQKEQSRPRPESNRPETRKQERENKLETAQTQRFDKTEKQEAQEQRWEKKEEEEGFAGGQQQQQQERPDEEDTNKIKVGKVDEAFAQEFASYAAEQSILSELFNMRVSQFDVLILFIEILKLEIKGREQERIARSLERQLQLQYMQNVVDNYKSQGKWLLFSSLGSGVLGIVSGASPIIGHMKGDWIIQKLGGVFSSLRDMKKDQFFKGITKITFAMSEMQKSTGQIHNTFSEGTRTFDQHMSDLHRADWEENTRIMEEIKDSWKGIENFLYQSLQMYHEAIRQLYSH